jgi:hypothetical protein
VRTAKRAREGRQVAPQGPAAGPPARRGPRESPRTSYPLGLAFPIPLTGGGFGGSVIVVAKRGRGRSVAERVVRAYDASAGFRATVLVPRA